MTTVLLAVDETAESIDAVGQARSLFGPDATYLAVNVAESPPRWAAPAMTWGAVYPYPFTSEYPDVRAPVDEIGSVIDDARETAHQVAGAAGVSAAAVGEVGDPAPAILAAADDHDADVIVVGSSHKGWWRRLFEGSVSRDVAKGSRVPVLVVGHHSDDTGSDGP